MTTESKKLPTIEGFTPGPWKASEPLPDKEGCIGISTEGPQTFLGRSFDGPTLGFLYAHRRVPMVELLGNAKLVAAAPDLYRIAYELMDPSRKTVDTPLEHEQREVIKRLIAAIGDEEAEEKAIAAAAPFLED